LQVAPQQVDVSLEEWAVTPGPLSINAGDTVTFNISNVGRFGHALEVSGNGIHGHSDTIGGSSTTTMSVSFEFSGTYTILCPIPGHEQRGMVGEITVGGANPAPASDAYMGIPLMRLSPRSGTVVPGASQDVSLTLHDFTLNAGAVGGANVAGEGNWDLSLDGQSVASVGTESFTLEGLTAGSHTITAALRNNDGTPLDPAVEASATITVATQVDIALEEWALIPSALSVNAGDSVTFNISNTGNFGHALEVSGNGIHAHSETIGGGGATTLTVSFEFSGDYRILCPIPGHEQRGMVGDLTAVGANPPTEPDAYMGIPLMRLSPRSGSELEGGTQDVSVTLHDFILNADTIGAANVAGEGNWELTLDGTAMDPLGAASITLENLAEGEHTILAALKNNDGTPLDPPVEASGTFTIVPPAAEPPSVGDSTVAPGVLAGLSVFAVLLLGSGGMLLRRRSRI
jgi:plastocyanin